MATNVLIIQDLKTYNLQDLDTLIKYYHINPDQPVLQVLTQLANSIHKTGEITRGQKKMYKELENFFNDYKTENADKIIELLRDLPVTSIFNTYLRDFRIYGKTHDYNDKDLLVFSKLINGTDFSLFSVLKIYDSSHKEISIANIKKIIELLIEKGYDINYIDVEKENILFKLSYDDIVSRDLLEYLVEKGANINQINIDELNALCYAIHNLDYTMPGVQDFLTGLFKYFKYDYDDESSIGCNLKFVNLVGRKIVTQALRNSFNEKLNELQQVLDLAIHSLDTIFDEEQKASILDQLNSIQRITYSKKGRPIKHTELNINTMKKIDNDTLKKIENEYEMEKQILEKKIKYLYDTIDLYPGGKTYRVAKKDFEERAVGGSFKTAEMSSKKLADLKRYINSNKPWPPDASLVTIDEIIDAIKDELLNKIYLQTLYLKILSYSLDNDLSDSDIKLIFSIILEEKINRYSTKLVKVFNTNPKNAIKLIDSLEKHGIDLNMYNAMGQNILFPNNGLRDPDIIQYLVDKGVKIDKPDNFGNNAICYIHDLIGNPHDKEMLIIYFKYIDFDPRNICPNFIGPGSGRITHYIFDGLSEYNKNKIIEAFKEAHEQKLEILRETYDLAIDSLDNIEEGEQIKENINDRQIIKPIPEPKYEHGHRLEIELDNIKLKYAYDKQVLQSKIKYLYDTLELYPGGKTFKNLEKSFKEKAVKQKIFSKENI